MSAANQLVEANQRLTLANQLIEGGVARRGSRGGVSGDLRCLWMWRRSFGRLNGFLNGRAELAKGGNEMDMIFKLAIPIIMQIVEQLLSPANIIKYGDKLFDFIEDAVTSSETTIDDATVLPLIKALRNALSIPDND